MVNSLDTSRLNDIDVIELTQLLRKCQVNLYPDGTIAPITKEIRCKTWGVCLTPEVPCVKKCVYEEHNGNK